MRSLPLFFLASLLGCSGSPTAGPLDASPDGQAAPTPDGAIITSDATTNNFICPTSGWCQLPQFSPPTPRSWHSAVWTGSALIVWGGSHAGFKNDGYRWAPLATAWVPIDQINTPTPRARHTAIWTGSEMVIWGGTGPADENGQYSRGDGHRWNPVTGVWTEISRIDAPSARSEHSAVWTGSEMIIWGGVADLGIRNDSYRWNPVTDTWVKITQTGTPFIRSGHSAIWTGSETILWGGNFMRYFGEGFRWNPISGAWSAISSVDDPSARAGHSAIWTGSEMIVWGGGDLSGVIQQGSLWNPISDRWSLLRGANEPAARRYHSAVWTGFEMIVWGGNLGNTTNQSDGVVWRP